MIIQITIDTSNAAFDVAPMDEVRAILGSAADKLDQMPYGSAKNLYDTNGNLVGEVKIAPGGFIKREVWN